MMCVTTRFQIKHLWALVPMYLMYRRMHHELDRAPGLIRYAFLVQSPRACCTLSVWTSEEALMAFANNPVHIHAVRRAKRWCSDIWSAYWRLDAVSKHANRWPGMVEWPLLQPHPRFAHRLIQPSEGRVAR